MKQLSPSTVTRPLLLSGMDADRTRRDIICNQVSRQLRESAIWNWVADNPMLAERLTNRH